MPSVIRGSDDFDSSSTGASTDLEGVGTYAACYKHNSSHVLAPGATTAASNLKYGNFGSLGDNYNLYGQSATAVSAGTWRCMGYTGSTNNNNGNYDNGFFAGSIFVRIS